MTHGKRPVESGKASVNKDFLIFKGKELGNKLEKGRE